MPSTCMPSARSAAAKRSKSISGTASSNAKQHRTTSVKRRNTSDIAGEKDKRTNSVKRGHTSDAGSGKKTTRKKKAASDIDTPKPPKKFGSILANFRCLRFIIIMIDCMGVAPPVVLSALGGTAPCAKKSLLCCYDFTPM